jgi:hypothetical protein
MTIFKPITMKWWQAGLLKLAMLSLGLVVGASWPGIFIPWRAEFLLLFLLPSLYLLWLWWKQ